jgi:protocatechuate 3,4-dioxygenase beta subunit
MKPIPKHLTRREALGALGAAAGALGLRHPPFLGDGADAASAERLALLGRGAGSSASPAHLPGCIVTPQQAEGPYFVDERLERADIRVDPLDGSVSQGLPLTLSFNVQRVDGTACSPLTGAVVDLWQCDAAGVYSDVRDTQGRFDTREKKFLRGHQLTNAAGGVEFRTIFPGWYQGRTPHVHFKVRLYAGAQRTFEFTSQLYFEESVIDRVYAFAPYDSRGPRSTRNDRDGIFQRESGPQLIMGITDAGSGLRGTFDIGLRMG